MARPVKATVDYFPHQVTHGKTLFILESRWGNDGYAFWFKLLETLGTKKGHFIDCNDINEWEFLTAKTRVDGDIAVKILDTLANLQAIDPELWAQKVIFSPNFVDGVKDAYRRRKELLPSITALKASFCCQKPPDAEPQGEFMTETTGKGKEREREREIIKDVLPKPKIGFDWQTHKFTNLNGHAEYWKQQFPAIDVEAELRAAEVWQKGNPRNRKSNYLRFLTTWLIKAQDQAPRKEARKDGKAAGPGPRGCSDFTEYRQE